MDAVAAEREKAEIGSVLLSIGIVQDDGKFRLASEECEAVPEWILAQIARNEASSSRS
jgi:hypothetical protein